VFYTQQMINAAYPMRASRAKYAAPGRPRERWIRKVERDLSALRIVATSNCDRSSADHPPRFITVRNRACARFLRRRGVRQDN
jgi:hypothetical protein